MQAGGDRKPGCGRGRDRRPAPGPDEVVVEVGWVSAHDVHLATGSFRGPLPLVPGHEFAVRCRHRPQRFWVRVGAKVTADPNNYCGRCRPCREGHGNMCTTSGPWASPTRSVRRVPGRSAWNVHLLPDAFDMSVGRLIEPLSCPCTAMTCYGPSWATASSSTAPAPWAPVDLLGRRGRGIRYRRRAQRGAPPDGPGLRRRGGRRERGRARRRRRLRRRDRRLGRRRRP